MIHTRFGRIGLAAGAFATLLAAAAPINTQTETPAKQAPDRTEREQAEETPPGLLLVDDAHRPTVRVQWRGRDDKPIAYSGARPYREADERKPLGGNIEAFMAVGGTRVDLEVCDARAQIIRVGFYKTDPAKPFFPDIREGDSIRVTVRGIRFNQPAEPDASTVLMHNKWNDPGAVLGCVPAPDRLNLYLTTDPDDTLGDKITKRNGVPGFFAPKATDTDTDTDTPRAPDPVRVEDDGSITLDMRIPYDAFKHVDEPWRRARPGLFKEPYHFHVEFEVLPKGVTPYRPAIQRSIERRRQQRDQTDRSNIK